MAGTQLIEGEGVSRTTGFTVPVERLLTFPRGHPNFDERSEYAGDKDGKYDAAHPMVRNVIALGVHDPLTVRVVKEAEKYTDGETNRERTLPAGEYVVNGHQRRAWALAAKKELHRTGEDDTIKVPVIGEKTKDGDYLATLSFALNRTVADDPMVTARKLAAMLARHAGDENTTATKAGVTLTYLRQHVALLETTSEIQQKVTAGEIAPSAAAQLAAESPEVQTAVIKHAEAATAAKKERKANKAGAQESIPGAKDAAKSDGRRKTKVTVKDVASAAKAVKAGKAPEAETVERPTDRQIKARMKSYEENGHPGLAAELRWVLTGSTGRSE